MFRMITLGALCALVTAPVLAQQNLDEERLRALVIETIRDNPELIVEALETMQAREEAARDAAARDALSARRELLEFDPNAPVLGNPQGDVTIVEFFDYNCGFCRRAAPEVAELLAADENVRLVQREWPILSEGSVFAARAALAAREQDSYAEMHDALMALSGRVDERSVMTVAAGIGLDLERLRADMDTPAVDAHLRASGELARALSFNGTPSFVIGGALVPGFVEAERLAELVAAARDEG